MNFVVHFLLFLVASDTDLMPPFPSPSPSPSPSPPPPTQYKRRLNRVRVSSYNGGNKNFSKKI